MGPQTACPWESELSPQTDFEFPNQNIFLCSQLLISLRIQSIFAQRKLILLVTEPSVCRGLSVRHQCFLDLSVLQFVTRRTNIDSLITLLK